MISATPSGVSRSITELVNDACRFDRRSGRNGILNYWLFAFELVILTVASGSSEEFALTTFQDREQAFEAKFAHDEEFRFLVTARRDKLFAQWAADRLQLAGANRTELGASVLALRDGVGHDQALCRHVAQAFVDQGNNVQELELATALNECAIQARQQLLSGLPTAAH